MSVKREVRYERRHAADRMEAFLLGVTAVSVAGGIFAFFSQGWLAGLAMWVLSALAFALSRLFELIGELFRALDEASEGTPPRGAGKSPNQALLSTVRPTGMPPTDRSPEMHASPMVTIQRPLGGAAVRTFPTKRRP